MDEKPSTSSGTENPQSPGDEFEPTAEMMVNDFDDERTLDEEEALEETEDQQNELSNLEKEKDMPIEALLAMYGYKDSGADGSDEEEEEEEDDEEDENENEEQQLDNETELQQVEVDEEDEGEDNNQEMLVDAGGKEEECEMEIQEEEYCDPKVPLEDDDDKEPPSMLHELYKDDPSTSGRHLRSGSRPHSEDELEGEEEEEDGDYSPEEDDWKKTIMVGSDYQAGIPDGLSKYGDAMPYENEDKLLWCPSSNDRDSKHFLVTVQNLACATAQGAMDKIPRGSHVRDDEQALYLLQQCGHNQEEALRRLRMTSTSTSDTMSLWSEEECRNFEMGLRQFGKDFHLIQQNKVRTRSVNELVQFYYLWKKTERHDVFANKARLEKKKYILHPGTTDFMERFLDEQDSPVTSPNVHSLLAGDPKRHARTPPPSSVVSDDNMDEARIFSRNLEELARHLDKEGLESLMKLAAVARPSNGISNDTVTLTLSGRSFHSTTDAIMGQSSYAQ